MKYKHILIFTTSLLLLFTSLLQAQTALDTVNYRERYGLRVGVDLSKPLRTLLQEDYRGLEIMGDYRIYKDYYLAAELGNEQLPFEADNLRVTSNGSYIKIGGDYNAYDNWAGMENIIFGGLRYGFATFSQTLEEYDIYTRNKYFPPQTIEGPFENAGLTAHWVELVVGLKVEILHNLYLGGNVQLKRMITQNSPNNLDNLTIPGFNRTYDESSFGVGYSYNLSYLIPLYRRERN
ncbi:hypothetical protein FHG64_02420 [Antarcticibacterium flavum]|uniref:Outer membrane protein beta-barrel domain-containing protein n=1 Tax=Antarcticibacterium flavum TaxID=2058175 RepID=A0A5B7X165_9FLAO|nr:MULTISPECIES: DUF6048 family protein [Antarcticibacterium]MCM4161884.1 hypothetical protein [Antarcticibacterium sp. W02-3]QCY68343.1 hypothetical protein FHG64_02420 [Antarcticibacterium flavum]